MYKNGIAFALIEELPDRMNARDLNIKDRDLLRVIEQVPKEKPARYKSDYWDFTECFKHIRGPRNYIDFRRAIPEAKEAMKGYASWLIENGRKISTVSNMITNLDTNLRRMYKLTGTAFAMIRNQDIEAYISSLDCRWGTKAGYVKTMLSMFESMTVNKLPHLVDLKALQKYSKKLSETAKHEAPNHFKPIPEAYLNRLITMFDLVMRDESKPYDQRMTAGIMLLETQLGLRSSEIPIIPADCVRYVETTKGTMPYIIYRSVKAARGSREVVIVEHMGTDLAFNTLRYYMSLRQRSPYADVDYLYIDGTTTEYPILADMLQRRMDYLVKQYMPEGVNPVDGVDTRVFRNDHRTWYIPSIHSYRVTVFSEMANQGVPYPFIEKMMSHTPGMGHKYDEGYYGGVKRPQVDVWEDTGDDNK